MKAAHGRGIGLGSRAHSLRWHCIRRGVSTSAWRSTIEKRKSKMNKTKIKWTETTWNPVSGCTKVSAGCANCYAERLACRLQRMKNPRYKNGFKVTLHADKLDEPRRWKRPTLIFVNSMSDLFHEEIPLGFIRKVFDTIEACPQHRFTVLTKRSERMRKLAPKLAWPDNLAMGVTVENERVLSRVSDLLTVPARIRWVSAEPLLGPLPRLAVERIDWLVVGGEAGPGARPMDMDWARDLRDRCVAAATPFFFKQIGGKQAWVTGRLLDGQTWDEQPVDWALEQLDGEPTDAQFRMILRQLNPRNVIGIVA